MPDTPQTPMSPPPFSVEREDLGEAGLFTPRQQRVYDLLRRLISHGAAYFFADACEIVQRRSPYRTTTHIVGHLSREVESALRQVLRTLPDVARRLEPNGKKGRKGKKEDKEQHAKEVSAIIGSLRLEASDVGTAWASFVGDESWHLDAHRDDLRFPRRPDDEFAARFELFTSVLDAVLDAAEAEYSAALAGLDAVLAKSSPGSADADLLAIHLAPGVTAVAHIFESLGSGWLVPLRERRVFEDPPGVTRHGDGAISFPDWPQAQYLARSSADLPDEVAATIEQIPATGLAPLP